MLGLPDRFHAFVVLQRFRQRCRSRGTDFVVAETARIAMNTQKEGSRDSVRPKREDVRKERERERKEKNNGDGRKEGRDALNAWLT